MRAGFIGWPALPESLLIDRAEVVNLPWLLNC